MRERSQPKQKSIKEQYLEQYEASKKGGERFFPGALKHDAIVALLVVAVVFTLAILYPAVSEGPADPSTANYNPRPEWYFLFFFEFLKLFPGYLEPFAAVVFPAMFVVLLFLVPFISRGLNRTWSARKISIGIGLVFVILILSMEVKGYVSAPPQPSVEENPLVLSGQEVYRDRNCSYCHSINGVGGAVGPDLSGIGARMDEPSLTTYLENPSSVVMQTLHPKMQFTSEELESLGAYLLTLGAQIPYSPEAPQLVEQYCQGCHVISGKGNPVGPDLTTIGSRRSPTFLESFITDPKAQFPTATMPAFKGLLTQEQISDMAAYLYSLRQPSPTPTPAPAQGSR